MDSKKVQKENRTLFNQGRIITYKVIVKRFLTYFNKDLKELDVSKQCRALLKDSKYVEEKYIKDESEEEAEESSQEDQEEKEEKEKEESSQEEQEDQEEKEEEGSSQEAQEEKNDDNLSISEKVAILSNKDDSEEEDSIILSEEDENGLRVEYYLINNYIDWIFNPNINRR